VRYPLTRPLPLAGERRKKREREAVLIDESEEMK
jgi:hypothetical protein